MATNQQTLDGLQNRRPAGEAQQRILHYLRDRLPDYPFDSDIDAEYVEELLEDFREINILAEIKAYRWYHDNRPFNDVEKPRLALRRWLTNAWPGNGRRPGRQ